MNRKITLFELNEVPWRIVEQFRIGGPPPISRGSLRPIVVGYSVLGKQTELSAAFDDITIIDPLSVGRRRPGIKRSFREDLSHLDRSPLLFGFRSTRTPACPNGDYS
jgi:hypothetical protein